MSSIFFSPFLFFLLAFLRTAIASSVSPGDRINSTLACSVFKDAQPNITYLPDESMYTELNHDFFSATSWLGPACIVAPTTARQMSDAVTSLVDGQTPFAIRGGGHMPIPNAANIDSTGVLLASASLNQLKLSDDRKTIEVGPGNKWTAVYQYLEQYELTVVGGRASLVGVPGFLLGGGISFFSNEHGWASANVVQFDCVLAKGNVVSATANNEFSDLFWALRGGGNSYAIITAFHLTTYPLPAVAVGEMTYGANAASAFLDNIYHFVNLESEDPKAGIEPRVQWFPSRGEPTYHAIMFYDGDDASPAPLSNFTDPNNLEVTNSTFRVRPSMYNWTEEADPGRDDLRGLRVRFNAVSIRADRQGLQIIHDTFLETVQANLATTTNLVASLAFVPLSRNFLAVSEGKGGDPMGINSSQAPYILAQVTLLWSSPTDDQVIVDVLGTFNADIGEKLRRLDNVLVPYLYLNYADDSQQVFDGYPQENVQRLREIRDQYDPTKVFTNLMAGGWKIDEGASVRP